MNEIWKRKNALFLTQFQEVYSFIFVWRHEWNFNGKKKVLAILICLHCVYMLHIMF